MDIIEETQDFLIKEYGQPKEEIINGKKYKFVNSRLNNFNKLLNSFKIVTNIFGLELNDNHFAVICDFAKYEVDPNVDNLIKKLNAIVENPKNLKSGKRAVEKLLNDFEEYYLSNNYNVRCIMNLCVSDLKCKNINDLHSFSSVNFEVK